MSNLSYEMTQRHYAEAMQFSGPEATGRLWIADRLAEAARETLIAEAIGGAPRVRPVILSLGGLLVRLGERLEAAGTVERCEYA